MADKRTIAYWGILLAVVLIAGLVICITPTQSRYVHTAVWNTIVLPGEQSITSDYLQDDSQVPMTVVLGQMEPGFGSSIRVPFQMRSEKGLTGGLTWSVDKPEYIQVTMKLNSRQLQQGGTVALAERETVTVTMDLEVTDVAAALPREETRVTVEVSWGGILKGTFVVDLPKVESTAPEGTQEPSQPEAEPEETLPAISTQSVVQIKSVKSFTQETILPVTVTADNKTEQMVLGIATSEGTLGDFPKETRYSLDQGESYCLLYNGGTITLPVLESQTVLLDFSQAELQGDVLDLQMDTYKEEQLHKTARTSVSIFEEPLYQLEERIMEEQEALQIRLNPQWANYAVAYRMEKVSVVTTELGDYTQYTPIDPALAGFVITVTEDPTGDLITVAGGEERPAAGSYVLRIQWSNGELDFGQTRIPFFVHYYAEPQPTAESATETTGGAEP